MTVLDLLPPDRRSDIIERAAANPTLLWTLVIATVALAISIACAVAYRRKVA